ncbi:MAG: adenosine deaminase [Treponemataceae bacterium]|nr:adenosine deaminase [Spirochaetales bacterium]MDY6031270.1 adenosine deaminase [Treponemataceae bacterium]
MVSVSDFITLKKVDCHNHLNLGMRYASYVPWAGFQIPNFPRKMNGLGEMHEVIGQYTRVRIATKKDVQDVITLAVQDAVADGITVLEGSFDINFVNHCGGNVDEFCQLAEDIRKKFEGKIDLRPELGMGKLFDKAKIDAWVPECLKSGVFKSLDLYGPEVEDGLDDFVYIYDLAGQLGIKKKAHVGEFSDANSVKRFIEIFNLDEVQHGIGAAKDDKIMQFLKDKNIRCNITPASNVMLSAVPSLEEHPIKKFVEWGIPVTIGTDDLLFFNKSVSEQCVDLVNSGVLTVEQIKKIFSDNIASYGL